MKALAAILLSLAVAVPAHAGEKDKKKEKEKKEGKKDTGASADKLIKSGESAFLAGDLDGALAIFKKAVKTYPDDARGYYYCGMVYTQKGCKDEAEKMYRAALEKDPKLAEALNNLSDILIDKKGFEEAEKLLKQALEIDPKYFEAQYNMGWLYEEWGKPPKAVEAYEKASKIDTKDTDALIAVAEIQAARGEHEKAVEAYRKAIKRKSSLAALKIEIADLLVKLGKKEDAAAELEDLLSMITISEGADLQVPFKAARGLRLAGKPGRTIEILEKFPAKAQETFSVQTEIGQCWMLLGKCSKAVKAFKKAQKIKPDSPDILLAIADALVCAKKCKDAKPFYQDFLKKIDPADPRKKGIEKKLKSCKK